MNFKISLFVFILCIVVAGVLTFLFVTLANNASALGGGSIPSYVISLRRETDQREEY